MVLRRAYWPLVQLSRSSKASSVCSNNQTRIQLRMGSTWISREHWWITCSIYISHSKFGVRPNSSLYISLPSIFFLMLRGRKELMPQIGHSVMFSKSTFPTWTRWLVGFAKKKKDHVLKMVYLNDFLSWPWSENNYSCPYAIWLKAKVFVYM